ncbi:hypothetical protein ACO1CV_22450, partial [Escherichia coli]
MSLHKEFVWVGLPTNVYTAFSDYVYISAELSYLMMVIHGCISGVLWRLSRNYISVKIFYSYFIYTFSFIFYHESFMTNISSWIQITLCIIVFSLNFLRPKIKSKCIFYYDLNFSRRDAGFKARKDALDIASDYENISVVNIPLWGGVVQRIISSVKLSTFLC